MEIEATYFDIQIKLQQLRQAPIVPSLGAVPCWGGLEGRLAQEGDVRAARVQVRREVGVHRAGNSLN